LPVSIVIDPPMPCLGEAVRCNYRFWIPIPKPQENKRLNKYSAKVNEFTFEGRDKEIIDIKGEVQAIFNASKDKEDELNGNFESFVKAWMVLINQKIAEKVGSNDWLKLEYIHDDIKGVGQLRVERFDCLIYNFDLSVSYNHPASTEIYELRYSVDGLSITAKGDDPVFFPPVDCETLNKCNKETTWQPRCIPKSFELNIVEKNAEGSKLSLKAASSDINPSLFVWEVAEAKPSIANGSSVSMLLSEPIPKLIHIQVTAFDQDGCSVTIKDTLQFPQ
jgi:hypothetical protein